jgi:hypothetical protein
MQDRIELLGGTIHFASRKVQDRGRKSGNSGGTAIEFHLPLHEVDTK